jgi:hypothetical protein
VEFRTLWGPAAADDMTVVAMKRDGQKSWCVGAWEGGGGEGGEGGDEIKRRTEAPCDAVR